MKAAALFGLLVICCVTLLGPWCEARNHGTGGQHRLFRCRLCHVLNDTDVRSAVLSVQLERGACSRGEDGPDDMTATEDTEDPEETQAIDEEAFKKLRQKICQKGRGGRGHGDRDE